MAFSPRLQYSKQQSRNLTFLGTGAKQLRQFFSSQQSAVSGQPSAKHGGEPPNADG